MIAIRPGTRLVILDLDSTLVEMPIDWAAMKEALAAGFPGVSFTRISDGLREVGSRYGAAGLQGCFAVIRQFEQRSLTGMRPIPPVLATVREHRGLQFAICSNNLHATVDEVVEALGLRGVFRMVVGRDDVSEGKPAPEGLLKILAQLAVPASEALFVGNHDTDAEAGRRAGIETVLVQP